MSFRSIAKQAYLTAMTTLGADARSRRRMAESPGQVVRILLAHATPQAGADAFRRQLDWASRHFTLIDFAKFKSLCADPAIRLARPAAMLTFDDGLLSNFTVGAPILEEFNARGVFFVVPRFSERSGADAARFFRERLKGNPAIDDQPMSAAQIRELADRGHTIGNHTLTHARLSQTPSAEFAAEILQSADIIESWIAKPVEAFAWTFAWDAITREAYDLAKGRHAYCFSPCPGLTRIGSDAPSLIWRTNVEAMADAATYRFMYSGLADPVWAERRESLKRTLGVS